MTGRAGFHPGPLLRGDEARVEPRPPKVKFAPRQTSAVTPKTVSRFACHRTPRSAFWCFLSGRPAAPQYAGIASSPLQPGNKVGSTPAWASVAGAF
jgi:hypothetical protein